MLFLRYVVESAANGELDCLKERAIGVSAFERDSDYDTNQDPVVRNTAGEVRKRLAQYYSEPGHDQEVRIGLPTGSYVPEVQFPSSGSEPVPEERGSEKKGAFYGRKLRLLLPAALIAGLFLWVVVGRKSDLDRFWDPVAKSQKPVLVCIGQPRGFEFVPARQAQLEAWFGAGSNKGTPPPELASVPLSDIVPFWDTYIDLLDEQGYEQIARLLRRRGQDVQLRGERLVSLSELRRRPVVLIGAFNNEWTLGLAGELRYSFQRGNPPRNVGIRDRQNPQKAEWTLSGTWSDSDKMNTDYAIVTRAKNPTTEQTVLIAAGVSRFGTHAATELITDEAYFREAIKGAPRDWADKNMQFVISVPIMSGTSGPPKVLARHFW